MFLIVFGLIGLNVYRPVLAEPSGYRNYEQISAELVKFTQDYPTKTYLYSIGKSVENRNLWVLTIANSLPKEHVKLRPEIKFIGYTI